MIAGLFGYLLLFVDVPPEPVVKLERGQEIVWKGTFREEMIRPSVTAGRTYTMENRLFVLEVRPQGADVAILTLLRLQQEKESTTPASARIVLARIDPQGRLYEQPSAMLSDSAEKREGRKLRRFETTALEGLPIPELGILPALPEEWQKLGKWEMPEVGRPFKQWTNEGTEELRGARCYSLHTQQQNEDWDKLTGKTGWRIRENIWLSASHGYATKFERTYERKDPTTAEVRFRTKVVLSQAGQLRYSGRAYDERREEISTGVVLTEEFEKLALDAGKTGPMAFSRLLARIDYFTTTQRPLGEQLIYREALNGVKRKAEAAMRGHVPAALPQWTETASGPTALNKPMTDFESENFNSTSRETWRLSQAKGKPVLLIYFQPQNGSAETVMMAAQQLKQEFRQRVGIVGMAIGQPEDIQKQSSNLKIDIPILFASDLRKLQGIESTPTMIVIDTEGIVRKIAIGWGDESLPMLREELNRWVK